MIDSCIHSAAASLPPSSNERLIDVGRIAREGEWRRHASGHLAIRRQTGPAGTRYSVIERRRPEYWSLVFDAEISTAAVVTILREIQGNWMESLSSDSTWSLPVETTWEPEVLGVAMPRPKPRKKMANDTAIRREIGSADAQDDMKSLGWSLVLDPQSTLLERASGALLVMRAWFDRSLSAHIAKDLGIDDHPDFWTYCAMSLHEREANLMQFGGDDALVDLLIECYGQRPGLRGGDPYWKGQAGEADWRGQHRRLLPYGVSD